MAVTDQVAGNFDHLLMADAQFTDRGVRVDGVEPDPSHGGRCQLAQALVADPAETAGQVVEKQVFRDGQRRQQVQFLHDHAHTKAFGLAAAAGRVGLATVGHVPGGGHLQAADELGQRTLARAVLAGQGQHFAGAQAQADLAEHGLGVGLAQAAGGKHHFIGRCRHGRFSWQHQGFLVMSSTGV